MSKLRSYDTDRAPLRRVRSFLDLFVGGAVGVYFLLVPMLGFVDSDEHAPGAGADLVLPWLFHLALCCPEGLGLLLPVAYYAGMAVILLEAKRQVSVVVFSAHHVTGAAYLVYALIIVNREGQTLELYENLSLHLPTLLLIVLPYVSINTWLWLRRLKAR